MAEVVLSEIRRQLGALHCARERPMETLESVAGQRIAEGTGPNAGVWYVESVGFYSDRASAIHVGLTAGTSTYASQDAAQASCSGLSWNAMNNCMRLLIPGSASASSTLVNGILAHEGFGTPTSDGHQTQWHATAGAPGHNPKAAVESLIDSSQATVADRVVVVVNNMNTLYNTGGEPTGNFNSTWWIWSFNQKKFVTFSLGG